MIRYALVTLTWERDQPEAYLPGNYEVVTIEPHPERPPVGITTGPRDGWRQALIAGVDNSGWTLDGYVLPRLASGGLYGKEVMRDELRSSLQAVLTKWEVGKEPKSRPCVVCGAQTWTEHWGGAKFNPGDEERHRHHPYGVELQGVASYGSTYDTIKLNMVMCDNCLDQLVGDFEQESTV